MESFLEEVRKYDDATLRQKLQESCIPVGPITAGTKSVIQRRLAVRLFEQSTGTKFETDDKSGEKTGDADPSIEKASNTGAANVTADRKGSDGDVFYAICLPENTEPEFSQEVTQLVFSDKNLALKTAKKVKGSRFKAFKSESDAEKYSRLTAESAFQSPKKLPKEDVQVSTESSPYKGPKTQDVFLLRKALERGDIAAFKECVWQNPRYLVSSGDTPVMFQEGPRYTAMHFAALKNKPEMCRMILDTLEDPQFVNKLYCNSNNTEETQNSRINFLVDLYLNMPDKGNCESPLHMACKFGHDAVVEILAAHPKTDRTMKNKWGESPKDLICSRVPNSPVSLKSKIEELLKGQYYIPLIRSEDNSAPPVIGQPWSPDVTKSPLDMPKLSWSPKDPNMSIRACAGPMSPDDASRFHKRWTTPPHQNRDQTREYFNTKRSDSEKGMERIGRKLAHELHLPWKEYWDFLHDFVDISSMEGLNTMEEYFTKRKWILFIKDFKDKFGIHEAEPVFDDVSTPVANRSVETGLEKTDITEAKLENDKAEEGNKPKEKISDLKDETDGRKTEVDSTIVSPVTSLLQRFAKLKLDDSLSNTTLDSDDFGEGNNESFGQDNESKKNSNEDIYEKTAENNNVIQDNLKTKDESEGSKANQDDKNDSKHGDGDNITEKIMDDKKGLDGCESVRTVDGTKKSEEDKLNSNENKEEDSKDKVNSNENKEDSKNIDSGSKTEKGDTKELIGPGNDGAVDGTARDSLDKLDGDKKVTEPLECKDDKAADDTSSPVSDIGEEVRKKIPFKRLVSEGSESVSSYETAVDEVHDSSLSYVSESEDPAVVPTCINLKDRNVFDKIIKLLCNNNNGDKGQRSTSSTVRLIVRLIPVCSDKGMTVDIASIPDSESVKELLLFENVEVSSCTGDISSVLDGEEVELGVEGGVTEEEAGLLVQAYLTRSKTLPKFGYIHGPQPTREDLNVCRALSDSVITPTSHPAVFSWKISMSKFLKDTNFKWQSPAKLKSSLRQGSPQSITARGTSPVITYGSPLGLSARPTRDPAKSDIRTRLFPSIIEQ